MISYPLREYISSKKDDDYRESYSSSKDFSPNSSAKRWIYVLVFLVLLILFSIFYSYQSYIDPTCFTNECTDFVCQGYAQGLIGGQLCPELCTTKTLELQNCLGEHKHFRSRLFEDSEGNEVIRCYLRHPLSKSNPSEDVKTHFHFPEEDSTLESFYLAIEEHVQKIIHLENSDFLVEKILNFADFNRDGQISLSESRSIWSLIQIDEFLYTILLSDKTYTPKLLGTCGHLFALERVPNPHLPFNERQELSVVSDRPNWYQRVRLAVGIIEFFNDIWHFQDSNEHLFLCQPLTKSFGYDKDYESKILKLNHFISLKSLQSRLPSRCNANKDCLFDGHCSGFCNRSNHQCQLREFNQDALSELCSLVSSLVLPDGNATFRAEYQPLTNHCQQIVADGHLLEQNFLDFTSLRIRQILLLQNLKNLLWKNIEYQMGKITKKSTKKPLPSPVHANK